MIAILAALPGVQFSMPVPLLSGYGLQATSAVVRSDMESGAARVRRRSTSPPDNINLRYLLSDDDMAGFREYWDGPMQQGAAWVFAPVSDGRVSGTISKEIRALRPFKSEKVGSGYWHLELNVEVRSA